MPAGESENIRIYLRIRPFLAREDNSVNDCKPTSIVQVLEDSNKEQTTVHVGDSRFINYGSVAEGETFTFDAVAGPEIGQDIVFDEVAKPIADNCLYGYNGTIFA